METKKGNDERISRVSEQTPSLTVLGDFNAGNTQNKYFKDIASNLK